MVWIEDRLLNHPLSRRAILQELTDKGIDKTVATDALDRLYPAVGEKAVALELARARCSRYGALDKASRIQKNISFLARRGFSFSLARSVVDIAENQQGINEGDDSENG